MEYRLKKTSQFSAHLKRARKRGLDISVLEDVIEKLRTGQSLPAKYRNHELSGNYKGVWECHVMNDWLLLYYKDCDVLVLTLVDTGTHSDIFKK